MDTLTAIRAMSKHSGMSLTKAAEAAGMSRTYISASVSRGSTMKADSLAKVARAFGFRLVLEAKDGTRLEIEP